MLLRCAVEVVVVLGGEILGELPERLAASSGAALRISAKRSEIGMRRWGADSPEESVSSFPPESIPQDLRDEGVLVEPALLGALPDEFL